MTHIALVVAALAALGVEPHTSTAGAMARASSDASGKAPSLEVTPRSWSGSSGVTIAVIVRTDPYTGCKAHVAHNHVVQRPRTLRTSPKTGVGRWQWDVAKGVRGGPWIIRVRCVTLDGTHRSTVHLQTSGGPPARKVPRWLFAPGSLIVAHDAAGSGGGDNPYPQNQCTWWAWQKRPDLPYFAGLGGDALHWAESASRAGIPTGRKPVAGAIAVFPPNRNGVGYLGHVAYVEKVDGDRVTISEADFEHEPPGHQREVSPRGLTFIYGGPAGDGKGGVTQKPPAANLPAEPGVFVHHVYHTCFNGHCGLAKRSGPAFTGYQLLALLPDGTAVGIVCQTTGERVSGADGSSSDVWDQLADGSYVADYYVDTSGTLGAFSPPIPRCEGPNPAPDPDPPPFYTFHVNGTCTDAGCVLNERNGPGYTSYPTAGTLSEGTAVNVVCQVIGESVGTQQTYFTVVWDLLTDGHYVTDYYLDTPGGLGGFTTPIPRC